MPSIMEQKLVQDYFKADEVDNQIITHQMALSTGVQILTSLIKKIENDFRLLDKEKYTELITEIKKLNIERKTQVKQRLDEYQSAEDSDPFDEEQYAVDVNNIKHDALQKILNVILELGYKKGWFG